MPTYYRSIRLVRARYVLGPIGKTEILKWYTFFYLDILISKFYFIVAIQAQNNGMARRDSSW